MTRIEITVNDRMLGDVQIDNGRMSDLGSTMSTDPKDEIGEELDRTVARVKSAYGIKTEPGGHTMLGAAIKEIWSRGYGAASDKLLGQMVLARLENPEGPVADYYVAPRPIKDAPQA